MLLYSLFIIIIIFNYIQKLHDNNISTLNKASINEEMDDCYYFQNLCLAWRVVLMLVTIQEKKVSDFFC